MVGEDGLEPPTSPKNRVTLSSELLALSNEQL